MRIAVAAFILIFAAQSKDLPVEQMKKNIKVLLGLPSSQLIPVMAFMSNSLGRDHWSRADYRVTYTVTSIE